MPTPPLNTSYRSYRPAPGGGNRPAGLQGRPVGTAPISGVSVPQKSDLVSPQYTPTPVRTNTRAISSGNTYRTQAPRNKVVVQKTRRVVSRTRVPQEERRTTPLLKGGYLLFFLVLGLVIAKDFLDLLVVVFNALGAGLTATAIGSVIGIPLMLISEVISKIASLFLSMIIMTYFWFIGGKFAVRLVVISIGAIMDAIPIVNILPMATISFVIAFVLGRIITKVESATIGKLIPSALAKRI